MTSSNDDRISLSPLSPEEALAALLAVQPAAEGADAEADEATSGTGDPPGGEDDRQDAADEVPRHRP